MTTKGPIRIEKIAALILLIGFIVYGLFEAYNLILGPRIDILSPLDGSTIDEKSLIIEGKAKNVSFIALNDRQIFIDENGTFRDKLLLPEGYTIIKVVAEDRFKKRVEKRISLWRPYSSTIPDLIEELKNTSTSTATTTATSTDN